MNVLKKVLIPTFTISLLFCPTRAEPTDWKALFQDPSPLTEKNLPEDINYFFDRLFLSKMSRKPQKLSSIGLFESLGIYDHNAYLNDVSPEAVLLNFEEKKKSLELLKKYNYDDLSPEQKTSYKILLWNLNHAVSGKKFLFHKYKINHMFGILSNLTIVFTQFHPLETEEHVDLYITRLGRISKQLQQAISLLEHQKNIGVVPPAFTISKVINIIQRLVPESVLKNVFYSHLEKSIEKIETQNKDQLLEKAASVIETSVYPAFQALQQYLKTMLSNTTANNGVWALPDGDEYYAYMLKHHTTTDLSADQIHELGLDEVRKVQAEIYKILEKEGLYNNEKSFAELIEEMSQDPELYYPQTPEGRKQCLDDYRAILERSRKELLPLFNLKPKSPVKIEAVPEHREKDGSRVPHYLPSSIDGSRPGVFFVNLDALAESPKLTMETVTVHESEPGHHFQIALQIESDLPVLRKTRWNNAYIEGWALYTEKLAYEEGFFSSSFSELGHLLDELLRAVRLVIDTGIHNKRWTLDHAVDYMWENTGFPKEFVISEVQRYFVYPGQACSYKIGQLKILELRQQVKDALGEKFDIRDFHDLVLQLGSVPLEILEEAVSSLHQKA